MYILTVLIPLINVITIIIFHQYINKLILILNNIILFIISVIISLIILYEIVILKTICEIKLFNWIKIGFLKVDFVFLYDNISSIMIFIILFISFLVHLYSIEYMWHDPNLLRFFKYLSLFTFFMLILVTANNFLQLFLGWEGVGLSSYLLINFWYTRIQANKSAMKAMIINRFGDCGIYLSIILSFFLFKTLDFKIIYNILPLYENFYIIILNKKIKVLYILSITLLIGVIGKSAQFGLHTWLPDAMEGPTPVSSLLHAATMVTAGVYILIRCSYIFEYSKEINHLIILIGSLTSFFSASIGLVQNDLKKVVAFSTCSQLGYMVFACGLSNYNLAMFHLFNHAFFKALLFLGTGFIIHALLDEQDMRKMGGLLNLLPFSYSAILIGSCALSGIPFLTGYYSKDVIMEYGFLLPFFTTTPEFGFWLIKITLFLTSYYSFRLIILTFLTSYNGLRQKVFYIKESGIYMKIPLIILSFCSIFFGYIFKDLFIGIGTDIWSNGIFSFYNKTYIKETEYFNFVLKNVPLYYTLGGIIMAHRVYSLYNEKTINYFLKYKIIYNIYSFLIKKWYFDLIYNNIIVKFILYISYYVTYKIIDKGFIEVLSYISLIRNLKKIYLNINIISTGKINNLVFIFCFLIIITLWIIFFNINIKELFFIFFLIFFFLLK